MSALGRWLAVIRRRLVTVLPGFAIGLPYNKSSLGNFLPVSTRLLVHSYQLYDVLRQATNLDTSHSGAFCHSWKDVRETQRCSTTTTILTTRLLLISINPRSTKYHTHPTHRVRNRHPHPPPHPPTHHLRHGNHDPRPPPLRHIPRAHKIRQLLRFLQGLLLLFLFSIGSSPRLRLRHLSPPPHPPIWPH